MKAAAIVLALAGTAHAEGNAPSVVAPAPESTSARHGLAIGIEAGEPLSATAAWFPGRLGLAAAIGTGTFYGPGLSLHADVLFVATRIAKRMPITVGIGARWYNQHYKPMSPDEIPSSNSGLRASVAVGYELTSMQLYAELAPGVDVKRTPSCTLVDGPSSICPHAMATPLFVNLVVGARWFLGH